MAKEKQYTIDGGNAELWHEAAGEATLEEDNEGAITSYTIAARLGHAEAMNQLSGCYSDKDDMGQADLWARRAAAFGNAEAIEYLDDEYDPKWRDEFVDAIRTRGYYGEVDQVSSSASPADARAAADAGATGVIYTAAAAPAPPPAPANETGTGAAAGSPVEEVAVQVAGISIGCIDGVGGGSAY